VLENGLGGGGAEDDGDDAPGASTARAGEQVGAKRPLEELGPGDRQRYDVLFLKPPLTAAQAIKIVPTQDGVDRVSAGPGVLYFSRLIRLASRSRLTQLLSMPTYQNITVRNWNTTAKLLQAMDRSGGGTGR
jgi:uncharacterized protein (DUF1697 family)